MRLVLALVVGALVSAAAPARAQDTLTRQLPIIDCSQVTCIGGGDTVLVPCGEPCRWFQAAAQDWTPRQWELVSHRGSVSTAEHITVTMICDVLVRNPNDSQTCVQPDRRVVTWVPGEPSPLMSRVHPQPLLGSLKVDLDELASLRVGHELVCGQDVDRLRARIDEGFVAARNGQAFGLRGIDGFSVSSWLAQEPVTSDQRQRANGDGDDPVPHAGSVTPCRYETCTRPGVVCRRKW